MIRTNLGDLVLDNQTDDILLWKDTGYRFMQRESQYRTGWVDIENLPETTTTVAAVKANFGTTAAAGRALAQADPVRTDHPKLARGQ